jgi:hypothetical protein
MSGTKFAHRLVAALVSILAATVVWADDLAPVVVASIHDEPRDGVGDSFNDPPFVGLIRATSTREDRPIQEYDVSPYIGMTVSSATISGTIYNNNGGGDWPRTFDFILYAGNGQADLTDFEIVGTTVGTASWPVYPPPVVFSFDVTAVVQTVLDGGVEYVGLKVVGTSPNLFPCILMDDETAVLAIEATLVGDLDGDGDVDLADLADFLGAYGTCVGDEDYRAEADFDDSGCIDLSDLAALLGNYGVGT